MSKIDTVIYNVILVMTILGTAVAAFAASDGALAGVGPVAGGGMVAVAILMHGKIMSARSAGKSSAGQEDETDA